MTTDELIAKLEDLHAPIRVPTISEYQYACGEAALALRDLKEFRSHATEGLRCSRTAFVQGETRRCVFDCGHDGEHQVGRNGTTPFRWRT